jgi:hypothetical protein
MFTSLKGLVLKSKNPEEGKTRYTVILGRKPLFPWMYKTATLYKDLRDNSHNLEFIHGKASSIKNIKKRNLISINDEEWDILGEDLKKLPEKQKDYLRRNIENIPEKVKNAIYNIFYLELYPHSNIASQYGFEMQNVSKVSSKTESKLESLEKRLL